METIEKPEIDALTFSLYNDAIFHFENGNYKNCLRKLKQATLLRDCAVIHHEQRLPRKM